MTDEDIANFIGHLSLPFQANPVPEMFYTISLQNQEL
jgi:hypothetical protein